MSSHLAKPKSLTNGLQRFLDHDKECRERARIRRRARALPISARFGAVTQRQPETRGRLRLAAEARERLAGIRVMTQHAFHGDDTA